MQENKHRIDYLEFAVPDLAVAKAFYQRVFGWTFTDYGPDYTSFHDGRLSGGFHTDMKTTDLRSRPTLVVIFARDLEATESAVIAANGKIATAIFDFPGGRRFHFTDPNGLELAVWSDARSDGSKIG